MSKIEAYSFNNMNPGATVIRKLDPLVIEKPRAPIHIHTYGGETPFFRGLAEGRLMATKCLTKKCPGAKGFWLPPRVYCPDCLEKMEWIEVKNPKATVHTFIRVQYPGAFNQLPVPSNLISVEIEGCSTIMMSILKGGDPEIGLPVEPRFNTEKPSYTILDLWWVPKM
ncbi:MAG: hypothetical protein MUC63_06015 [Planctomycetes bacterium]|jgi:hypothetical protein|nr:hypothetical protein [Planctomycetota bacterium]